MSDGSHPVTGRLWALVMTPTRARIVRELVPGAPARTELVLRTRAPWLRMILRRGPGDARGAIEADGRDFVAQVDQFLEAHRRAGEFDTLVICAPPDLLATLREGLSPLLRARVAAELPHDLIHLPEAELPGALRALLLEEDCPAPA